MPPCTLRSTSSGARALLAVPLFLSGGLFMACSAEGQTTDDPFPTPIPAEKGAIRVGFREFARIPDSDGQPARMMLLLGEPGTRRLFVSDMRGPLYSVSSDGRDVAEYLDLDDPRWGVDVQSSGSERGFQSFAFHPQFAEPGTPGYGKLYTWTDTRNTAPTADFRPSGGRGVSHHTVLLEWTAHVPAAAAYDGGPPRELFRFQQPFSNHNGGQIAFDPTATPGEPDFGLLYVGIADGGSGGDPFGHAQNLSSGFGKIFRIDPLGANSPNGEYGIPADNPFAGDEDEETLGEIWAYGVRNPQRFAWDPADRRMFLADIGQNIVEELDVVTRGANLGWNAWEGSFRYVGRSGVDTGNPRSDPTVTYPVAEYDHRDPLFRRSVAVTGVHVFRSDAVPALKDQVVFGDNPNGEIFYVPADHLPDGGQAGIHRVLLDEGGEARTLLQLINERRADEGRGSTSDADLRFGAGPGGRLFLLNKQDGVIRLLAPGGGA